MDGFVITMGKGFHFKINGWTLSVQFGPNNMCTNHNPDAVEALWHHRDNQFPCLASPDAEIGLWRDLPSGKDGPTLRIGEECYHGNVSPVKVGRILGYLAAHPATEYSDETITFLILNILSA